VHYRADIDGLRAVAVVPVVLFHAGVTVFGGGYVGVDVFFVISGYLITSIIASEIDTNSFSIATFYQRRIRRIFPALVVVIAFCIFAGFVLLAPTDFVNLGKSILATAFFVSNIYFWRESGYFETPASERPLLHTWSLSIEEQFYVFFPLLLVLLSKYSRTFRVPILVAICLGSFALCAVLINYKPSATFYLGPMRAWELLFGCLIALGAVPISRSRLINLACALIGLALILFPIFFYTALTKFPGFAALPPVLGTGLLIWSGLGQQTSAHQVLSTAPFVAVGKASYSLYLWHFPILAFLKYVTLGELGPFAIAAACMLSLALAFVSLEIVERPFRFPSHKTNVRWAVAVATAGMVLVASTAGLVELKSGFPARLDAVSAKYLDAELDQDRQHMECLSLEERIVKPQDACKLGAKNVPAHVLLWGDSHSVVTATALEQSAQRSDAAFLFAGSVDCPIGLGFAISQSATLGFINSPAYQYCEQYNTEMLKLATTDPNITTVVLSSRWTNWRIGEPGSPAETKVDIRLRDESGVGGSMMDNRAIFARGFEKLIDALETSGKKVWIVGPLPVPSVRVPKALYVKHFGLDHTDIDIPRADFVARNAWIMSFFDKIAQTHRVNFIWPDAVLCNDKKCPVVEGDVALFFDHNHLSVAGAQKTSPLYDVIFSDKKQVNPGQVPKPMTTGG
jgi:peptidoglycan/LPS O-acetylase OafA/YrhL